MQCGCNCSYKLQKLCANIWASIYLNKTGLVSTLDFWLDSTNNTVQTSDMTNFITKINPLSSNSFQTLVLNYFWLWKRLSTVDKWSHEYNRLVQRFNNTISGQFFGHTHFDEFQTFFTKATPYHPVGVAFLGPSLTSHGQINPAYRIYYIDG